MKSFSWSGWANVRSWTFDYPNNYSKGVVYAGSFEYYTKPNRYTIRAINEEWKITCTKNSVTLQYIGGIASYSLVDNFTCYCLLYR